MNIDWLVALVKAWQIANLDHKVEAGTSFAVFIGIAAFLCYYVPAEAARLKAAAAQLEACIAKTNNTK